MRAIVRCRWRLGSLPLLVALALSQPACRSLQPSAEAPSQEVKNDQPGLFRVSPDQQARLKTTRVETINWPLAIHITGTVDWDADHTTQAITQVNGPITRILVDLGTPVKKDEPLDVRLQPRCRECVRHLSQGAEPRSVQQTDRRPHEGTAGPRRDRGKGFSKQRGRL